MLEMKRQRNNMYLLYLRCVAFRNFGHNITGFTAERIQTIVNTFTSAFLRSLSTQHQELYRFSQWLFVIGGACCI